MVKMFNEKMTKENVVASPKDEILNGVIIGIEKGLLSEFVKPEVHHKFDNLQQETLNILIDCDFKDKKIKVTDRLPYYAEPMTNSKLGKFLNKYEELIIGAQIKVIFDSDGFGKIKVD